MTGMARNRPQFSRKVVDADGAPVDQGEIRAAIGRFVEAVLILIDIDVAASIVAERRCPIKHVSLINGRWRPNARVPSRASIVGINWRIATCPDSNEMTGIRASDHAAIKSEWRIGKQRPRGAAVSAVARFVGCADIIPTTQGSNHT